jgi:hypothetical protein
MHREVPKAADAGDCKPLARFGVGLKHQQETSRRQTIALADRFRKVLFLPDIAAKGSAKNNNNERAA